MDGGGVVLDGDNVQPGSAPEGVEQVLVPWLGQVGTFVGRAPGADEDTAAGNGGQPTQNRPGDRERVLRVVKGVGQQGESSLSGTEAVQQPVDALAKFLTRHRSAETRGVGQPRDQVGGRDAGEQDAFVEDVVAGVLVLG